jgi:histone acetyltransferase 1
VEKDEVSFKPLGTKIGDYARRRRVKPTGDAGKNSKGKGKAAAKQAAWEDCSPEDEDAVVFEAYSTRFDTPGWKDYHRRMQIFVLFFIEGGSYIDEEDDRWEFVTLYEKRKSAIEGQYSYHFVGYTSLYEFFYWPDKTRLRLA